MNRKMLIFLLLLFWISLACGISMSSDKEPNQAQLQQTVNALNNSTSQQIGNQSANCDMILNVRDVTLPDGIELEPGSIQTKTWEMTNGGTCTWGMGYAVALLTKDHQIQEMYPLNQTVSPGIKTQISVPINAPSEPGNYRYDYMLVNTSGHPFGFGEFADQSFWAAFLISGSSQSVSEGDVQQQPASQPEEERCVLSANWVQSPIVAYLDPGGGMDLLLTIENTGTCAWDAGSHVEPISGDIFSNVTYLTFGKTIYPGENGELILPVFAGNQSGAFYQYWKLVTQHGELSNFGNSNDNLGALVSIHVREKKVPEPLPPEPEVDVNWNATKISWIGLGMCPTQSFDPEFTLTLTSIVDRTITYDFSLDGSQTHPTGKFITCNSPANNNRYIKELKANQSTTIKGKFTNCDLTGYTKGTITIKIFEKKTFSESKLLESSVQFEHTCGK